MYRQLIKISFLLFLFFLVPQVAQAGFLDDLSYCTWDGSCGLADIAVGFNSLIKLLLGGMGAVALVYFTWGGIQWLTSGGSAERVNRGKQIMINTVFSIILAFGSYLLVAFFINDVLNASDGFRVQQGEFETFCNGEPLGTICADNKECTGELTGVGSSWSNKCLGICQHRGLIASGYARLGECVNVFEPPWVEVPAGANGCSAIETCSYMPL